MALGNQCIYPFSFPLLLHHPTLGGLWFLFLWGICSQNRSHRLPSRAPYLSDEKKETIILQYWPVVSLLVFSHTSSPHHTWTAGFSSPQKNPQSSFGFEFTERRRSVTVGRKGQVMTWANTDWRGRAVSAHSTQRQPWPWDRPSLAPLCPVQTTEPRHHPGRQTEGRDSGLTDTASTISSKRTCTGRMEWKEGPGICK